MIKFYDLCKSYGQVMALKPLTLNFEKQKTHVLIGSSGCGKSTLLKLISGLVEPSSGYVKIDDQTVSQSIQQTLAKKIGYMIQEGGLFPHLTIFENVVLGARANSWGNQKINSRIEYLLSLVELSKDLLSKFPKQLSGGQRQRASLMRALMLDPEILLLDEPLGALDPIVRSNLQSSLKIIFNKLHKTVFLVTHDVWEGAYFGHTISLFDQGELIQHGQFADLVKTPQTEFVSSFVKAQLPPDELKVFL